MNFIRLKTFRMVAEHKNLRRSSELLNISQPAISRQTQILERELGADLFFRVHRRVTLTPAGQLLYDHAKELLDQIETVANEVRRLGAQGSDGLAIGAMQTTYHYLIPRAIEALRKLYPRLRISAHGFRSDQIKEGVKCGSLDMGIVSSNFAYPHLETETITRDNFVALTSTSHRLSALPTVSFEALLAEPVVTFPNDFPVRTLVEVAAKKLDIEFSVAVEVESVEAIKTLVRENTGVAIVPMSSTLGIAASDRLHIALIDGNPVSRNLVCISRGSGKVRLVRQNLIDSIRRMFAERKPTSIPSGRRRRVEA